MFLNDRLLSWSDVGGDNGLHVKHAVSAVDNEYKYKRFALNLFLTHSFDHLCYLCYFTAGYLISCQRTHCHETQSPTGSVKKKANTRQN